MISLDLMKLDRFEKNTPFGSGRKVKILKIKFWLEKIIFELGAYQKIKVLYLKMSWKKFVAFVQHVPIIALSHLTTSLPTE